VSPDEDAVVATLRAAGCVFAEAEARLLIDGSASPAELSDWIGRRVSGVPLEQIVGWVDFCGRRVALDVGVFVPRARTQLLVRLALQHLSPLQRAPLVVELCCGSAAIGASIMTARPDAELHACDIESAAVSCARRNLEPLGGYVHQGDLFAALPRDVMGRVDLLVANAPYVPSRAIRFMPPEARDFEPLIALDGGTDGLDVLRRLIVDAAGWLRPGGCVIAETSADQAHDLLGLAAGNGLRAQIVSSEGLDATALVASR
jgi:release factor glutamine methyltransferase